MGDLKRHHECPCCGDVSYEPLTGVCSTCTAQLEHIHRGQIELAEKNQERPDWLIDLEIDREKEIQEARESQIPVRDEDPILWTWNEGR